VNELLAQIRGLVPGVQQPEPRHAPPRPGEIRDSQADIRAAQQVLGYRPRWSFAYGLRQTVEWFARQGFSSPAP
jgi:UDP-glucose 4-epimerase